jgi:hypothetical protein
VADRLRSMRAGDLHALRFVLPRHVGRVGLRSARGGGRAMSESGRAVRGSNVHRPARQMAVTPITARCLPRSARGLRVRVARIPRRGQGAQGTRRSASSVRQTRTCRHFQSAAARRARGTASPRKPEPSRVRIPCRTRSLTRTPLAPCPTSAMHEWTRRLTPEPGRRASTQQPMLVARAGRGPHRRGHLVDERRAARIPDQRPPRTDQGRRRRCWPLLRSRGCPRPRTSNAAPPR